MQRLVSAAVALAIAALVASEAVRRGEPLSEVAMVAFIGFIIVFLLVWYVLHRLSIMARSVRGEFDDDR